VEKSSAEGRCARPARHRSPGDRYRGRGLGRCPAPAADGAPRAVLAPSSVTREDAHLQRISQVFYRAGGTTWSAVSPPPWLPACAPYLSWAHLAWRVALRGGTNCGRASPRHNRLERLAEAIIE